MNPTSSGSVVLARLAASVAGIAMIAVTGCTNLDRSRDLANPKVPPDVTAMQVCSNCHGIDGNSVSPNFPRLAGQQHDYLVEQLQNFRSHHRADPAGFEYMWGISRSPADEQIAGLADYYSRQTPVPNARSGDGKLVADGERTFNNGIPEADVPPCIVCHGQEAQGTGRFPRLAGQHADYLEKQLLVFAHTEGRPGTPMTGVTHKMDKGQIEAVAAYLQGLGAGQPQ